MINTVDPEDEKPATTSTAVGSTQATLARHLRGATFLGLEHTGFMALVVLLPVLFLLGADAAFKLWSDNSEFMILQTLIAPSAPSLAATSAVNIAAALLVLTPLLYLLYQRTSAELLKRPAFTGRVAYKLPLYGALALLIAGKLYAVTVMVAVFLQSLALIGVRNTDIGELYTGQFLPALLAAGVFGAAGWYVLLRAKGKDRSRVFVSGIMALAIVSVITLFVTATVQLHDNPPQRVNPQPAPLDDRLNERDLEGLFNF